MAEPAGRRAWTLALGAGALGAGALARHPLGAADEGLLFAAAYAVGVVVLALPLLLAEGALGQSRRRNAVDAMGPGRWRAAGWLFPAAGLLLAAVLALVAAWSARLAFTSFQDTWFGDPDRHVRLATQGWDALLFALGALVVAVAVALVPARMQRLLSATAVAALVAAGALAGWGLLTGGAQTRDAALALPWRDLDAALVVSGLRQALLPGLVGLGAVLTLSSRADDRGFPDAATWLAALWVAVPVAVAAGLATLAIGAGVALDGDAAFDGLPRLFAAIGATEGGMLAGTFYGLMLAGSLAGLALLLDVSGTWIGQRLAPGWTRSHGLLAAAATAYLVAAPLAFVRGAAGDVDLLLAAVAAPLGGLLVALHVGWARPQVLEGFRVGEARQRLDRLLRPVLRYAMPLPLLALLAVGVLDVLSAWGAIEAGSGGLWRLVP